jgi:hypothetical protein
MVVANKQDVVNSMGADEIADVELPPPPYLPPSKCTLFHFPSSLFPLPSFLFPLSLSTPNKNQKRCPGSNVSALVCQNLYALNPRYNTRTHTHTHTHTPESASKDQQVLGLHHRCAAPALARPTPYTLNPKL